ncbi:hypothetical protein CKN82_06665 [Carnobacterium divergens]|nr:hypothetical protein CKN76_06920 [Carnobacterium divergens]TFI65673.1 hypothetical protein CKN59_06905 [Carnobacterium divergens]TFI69308.1 hypothetical protein CKN70_06715 [Carnobacterium divergens]TFI80559.1 hypothetical protein CKN74_06885 [Carnobacterium divergens]TFI81570.1 hypothetical protein CKN68_06675 [Carnobacterium divergens]
MDIARCSRKWIGGTKMSKKILIIMVLVIGALFTYTSVNATGKKSYDSNSGVGFYGKYEYPDSDFDNPNQLVPPSGNQNGEIRNEEGQLTKLPQTGETNDSYLLLIGGSLLSTAVLLIGINKKNKTQEEFHYEIS